MKKFNLIIIFILLITSCKTIDRNYDDINLIPEYKMILNTRDDKRKPVIKYNIKGITYKLMIDTGTISNNLSYAGFKKTLKYFNFENKEFYINDIDNVYTVNSLRLKLGDDVFICDPLDKIFNVGKITKNNDGMLGQDFLKKYDNVVFDYKNKKILFNQPPISNNEIDLIDDYGICFIEVEINGNKMKCLLDTGSDYVFVPRNVKEKNKTIDFSLGNVNYKNLPVASIDNLAYGSEFAHMIVEQGPIFGYPIFKNHIIQFDFVNKKFRIM